jgi:hypothetical protein
MLALAIAASDDRGAMDANRARSIAERRHADDREEDDVPLLRHVRRVASRTPGEARAVAWLHEVFKWTAVGEHELLTEGLTSDELRALRLLHRNGDSRSNRDYLAHLGLIACSAGPAGHLARALKIADLEDRLLHPRVGSDGWSPPYARGLPLLLQAIDERRPAARPTLATLEKEFEW